MSESLSDCDSWWQEHGSIDIDKAFAEMANSMRDMGAAAEKAAVAMRECLAALDRPNRDEDYCDWSQLRKEWCAGKCCLNHTLDPDLEEAMK